MDQRKLSAVLAWLDRSLLLWADYFGHALHLPDRLQTPLCYRVDRALMAYDASQPEQHTS